LGQAIQNLIFFAVQAMPEGGRVEVAAAKVSVAKAALPPLPAGDYVRVTITDQGRGLEYEHLPKIFDPYFAFKTSGIGLGLATAHSVVRRHGGQIGAHSVLGRGTTFTIHLPVAAAAPPPPPTVETPMAQPAGGRVLVMDDEEEIGNLARLTLQRQGFEVEVARDGAEAIARFLTARQMGRPFAVVVLDLTIQNGMGGKETVQRLREVDPDIVAIVSSGYSFDPVMANFREYGFKGVVPKPYRPEELVRAVRALL
jgi:CheY-like chemotaxis protein